MTVGTVVSRAERAYFALSQQTTNPRTPYPVELPGAAAFMRTAYKIKYSLKIQGGVPSSGILESTKVAYESTSIPAVIYSP